MINLNNNLEGIAAVLVPLGGGILHLFQRLWRSYKKKKDAYKQAILDQAKLEVEKIRAELESKIKAVELELEQQKNNTSKELVSIKEKYNALKEQISALREDLNIQHQSVLALLTQLVNKK